MSTALRFTAPPPGLEPLVDFTLGEIDGASGLYALRAADDAGKRLFVVDAAIYLPDYHPVISDLQCAELDLTVPDDADVLVVANPGSTGVTVNLLAPIVVNTRTKQCTQVILDDQDWPLKAQLTTHPIGQN